MFRIVSPVLFLATVLLATIANPAVAENEGQADLDKATQLKVAAEGLDDLNEVIDHVDSALEKGLDADNKKFAEQLLVSSLLQRGQMFAAAVFNISSQNRAPGLQVMQFRQFALSDLERVASLDDKVVDAQLTLGKLQSMPIGDKSAARRAFSKVTSSADATADQKAEAYALRSEVQKTDKDKVDDLNKAVQLVPEKPDYLRLRAEYLYNADKYDEALADIDRALKLDPEHGMSNDLRGLILLGLNKYEEAIKSFDRSGELMPEAALPFQHRGELYRQKGDMTKALEQVNKALEIAPDSVPTLILRSGIYYELKETDKSLADVEKAIELQPTLVQPHMMKVEILAATNQLDKAISHLEKLLSAAPGNQQLLDRLSVFYLMAQKPTKAIATATEVLSHDPDDFSALRLRADAYLNMGKHAEAIADFEKALALKEDDQSLLNNFAWVLATSPEDKLRDGARAIKLATKAAEASGYETPHVLSTLAAAYAESGDFENAVKWSQKSIDLAQKEVDEAKPEDDKAKLESDRDQLKKELENYHDRKPTRERQTAEDADAKPAADRSAAPAGKDAVPEGTSGL
jgi:tetratricopeptide (TPR) repeat protein